MTLLVLMLLGNGDFWVRSAARSPEVEKWKLEGDQRSQMGQKEHLEEAEQAYAEVVRLMPHDARARLDHANALYRLERWNEVAGELQTARALDEHLIPGRIAFDIGVAYAHLGRYARAAQEYRRALDLGGEGVVLSTTHWDLGDVEMAMGHLKEAIRHYQLAFAAPNNTDTPTIELALAVAYDRNGESQRARAAARHAVTFGNVLGLIASKRGYFYVPPADHAYMLALAYEAAGERVSALERWREYLEAAPDSPWSPRARAHLDDGMTAPPRAQTPPGLARCAAGHAIVAEVRVHGRGTPAEVRNFPTDVDPEILRCLSAAAQRLTTPGRYEVVGGQKLDSRSGSP